MSTAGSRPLSDTTPTLSSPRRLVLMGVAGCGKSSVGAWLSASLGIPYWDGDDLHPAENIAKMASGTPLNDDDRWPWLEAVGAALAAEEAGIVGCSALKRAYRDRIRAMVAGPVTFIHLAGSRAVIEARMRGRKGHFMPPSLLDSQFAALEPPTADEGAVTVDINQSIEAVIAAILTDLERINP